jgi:1-acyl-sn-glycerol-3-phosphate acyltransferase
LLYGLLRPLAWLVFKVFFRLRIVGREYVPATGGALIACNHQSFADPVIVGVGVGRRQVAFMARRSLFENRLFAWLIRSVNAFPVSRGEIDAAAVKLAIEKMRAGALLLVFPEGTRTSDGHIGPIREGTVVMASRAGVPILPAVIHGAFQAWPRDASLPRPGRICIAFGQPIPAPGPSREERRAISGLLASRLKELQAELDRIGGPK